TSLQLSRDVVDAVHSYGGLVLHDVINVRHAQKAIDAGVDGIIAVCSGAGGHAGELSPFALTKEIRKRFDGIVVLAGAMSSGGDIAAARALGADLAYMGTRFIATAEANAVDGYKQMIVESAAEDVVYTSLFSGVRGNYLKGSVRNIGLDPDALPEADKSAMNFGSGGNTDAKAWVDIWSAGQGVGNIDAVLSVSDLVARLGLEFDEARARLAG
ncbi:MAG: nitronate monooxygenase family protein, partial [Pseudomonadota bacterium]